MFKKASLIFCLCVATLTAFADEAADKTALIIEALSRLQPEQINANPKLKEALSKVLEVTRGTPQFVKLVQQFQAPDQYAGLLESAINNPTDETSGDAIRMLLAEQGMGTLKGALASDKPGVAIKTAAALGNSDNKLAVPLLLPLITEAKLDVNLRKQAVHALARTREGASGLVQVAKDDKLPNDLKFTATADLSNARWPEIKTAAAQVLPPPQMSNAQALPPVNELLKMKGDAANGEKIFLRETTQCIKCHRVNDKGVDFGPALSEIGTKLGKDAIYEAILEPSAGISFGFEAWEVELKSGDDVFGLITSETAEALTMKDASGVATKIKKSDIAKRTQMKTSIMPVGLQQTMSTQEFVDLVEYLSSLKKK